MARRCAFWPPPSCGLQVLPHRHVAQRVGVRPPSAGRRLHRPQPAEERAADAPPLQLERQRGGRDAVRAGRAARRSGSRTAVASAAIEPSRVSGCETRPSSQPLPSSPATARRCRPRLPARTSARKGGAVGSILGNRVSAGRGPPAAHRRRHLRRGHRRCPARRGSPTSARRSPTPASPRIDVAEAQAAPGVLAVFTGADLGRARAARPTVMPSVPGGHAPAVRGRATSCATSASRSSP